MPRNKTIPLLTSVAIAATIAPAQTTTWTGTAGDGVWNNNANWTNNKVNFGGVGVFSGAPTSPQPSVNSAENGIAIDFQSAGWTILDGGGSLRIDGGTSSATYDINSSGAGVNQIQAGMNTSGSVPISINVDTGSTLQISGSVNWSKVRNVSGGGTLLFDGPAQTNSFNIGYNLTGSPTILANTTVGFGASLISGSGTWGGTAGYMLNNQGVYEFTSGNIIAPGGNGTFGAEIGTLNFDKPAASDQGGQIFLNGGAVNIQVGTVLGANDAIAHVSERVNTGFVISGASVLNLYGTTIEDGTYTIISSASPNGVTGTFSEVNFNDAPVNPSNFTVNYNANDITVDISGIPEPSTYALMAGLAILGLAVLRRRS